MSIQKTTAYLVVVLMTIFNASIAISTWQADRSLQQTGEKAGAALKESVCEKAQSVVISLETGTRGSMQRGDMERILERLTHLRDIPHIEKIVLTGPNRKTVYVNRTEVLGRSLPRETLNKAVSPDDKLFELEERDSLLLMGSLRLCLECHGGTEGDLGGVCLADLSETGQDLGRQKRQSGAEDGRADRRLEEAGERSSDRRPHGRSFG